MSHICVVMGVYNRAVNVRNALHSWSLQTRKDFSVVVVDDGSDDDILSVVREFDGVLATQFYRQPRGTRKEEARALNKGTLLAPPQTTHIWYTDGDIVFNPKAMEAAYGHTEEYPKRVIAGRYDYLPQIEIAPEHFGILTGRITRKDHRTRGSGANWFEHKLLPNCRAILGSNVIVPLAAWQESRGWDEHIPGDRAEDCDFGWSLSDAGYELLTCSCITGYHQWHPSAGVKGEGLEKALPYIFRKHGEEVPDRWKEKESA